MCIRHFVIIGVVCSLWTGGCTPEQIGQADQVLADANAVTTGVVEFVQGPAGVIFPPVVRTIAEILGIALAAALALWQQIKHKLTKKSLTAVVKGVERLDDETKVTVKDEIRKLMDSQAAASKTVTYARLNAEVDRAKAS